MIILRILLVLKLYLSLKSFFISQNFALTFNTQSYIVTGNDSQKILKSGPFKPFSCKHPHVYLTFK